MSDTPSLAGEGNCAPASLSGLFNSAGAPNSVPATFSGQRPLTEREVAYKARRIAAREARHKALADKLRVAFADGVSMHKACIQLGLGLKTMRQIMREFDIPRPVHFTQVKSRTPRQAGPNPRLTPAQQQNVEARKTGFYALSRGHRPPPTREEADRAVAAWLKTHTVTVCPPPAPIVGTPNAGAPWRFAERVG